MSITQTQKTTGKIKKKAKAQEGTLEDTLTALVSELLTLMGTTPTASVTFDQENDSYIVNIEGGDTTGLLIGRKGETLTSIQTVLGILLKEKTGEWKRIVVNVGDYREKEEDYLKTLARSAATRAKETGEPQSLYNLNAAQRRLVHLSLSEDSSIVTESLGEGPERYLVVRAK